MLQPHGDGGLGPFYTRHAGPNNDQGQAGGDLVSRWDCLSRSSSDGRARSSPTLLAQPLQALQLPFTNSCRMAVYGQKETSARR